MKLYSVRDIDRTRSRFPRRSSLFRGHWRRAVQQCVPAAWTAIQCAVPVSSVHQFSTERVPLELQRFADNRDPTGLARLEFPGWLHLVAFNFFLARPLELFSSDFDIRHRLTLALTYALPSVKTKWQLLEGWQINSIVALQGASPYSVSDRVQSGDDFSETSEFVDRWDFFGNPNDFRAIPSGIPFFAAEKQPGLRCQGHSCRWRRLEPDPTTQTLQSFGCYAKGSSVMIPPALGNLRYDGSQLVSWPALLQLGFFFGEGHASDGASAAAIRAEFFNILNHPQFANPKAQPRYSMRASIRARRLRRIECDAGCRRRKSGDRDRRPAKYSARFEIHFLEIIIRPSRKEKPESAKSRGARAFFSWSAGWSESQTGPLTAGVTHPKKQRQEKLHFV